MDDLLDLSWSDPPAPQPPRAGAGSSSSAAPSRTASTTASAVPSRTASAFDFLAKPAGGPNYSRTSTPLAPTPGYANGSAAGGGLASGNGAGSGSTSGAAALNGLLGSSAVRPASRSGAPSPAPPAAPAGSATPPPLGDAFSSLLGAASGSGAGSAASKNMTMAERQAQLAAEKRAAADAERSRWNHGTFWDSFEGVSGSGAAGNNKSSTAAPAAAVPAVARTSTPLQTSLKPTPPTSRPGSAVQQRPPAPKASGGSFWESEFVSPTSTAGKPASPAPAAVAKAAAAPAAPAAEADPWDFDSFPSATPSTSAAAAPVRDFEYHADGGDEDDDLLGDLGRPAQPRRSPPAREPVSRTGAASPPPHVVGQIVEMGFSPAQARAALAATSTGLDVQAALDSLLAGQGSGGGAGDDHELDDEAIAREMQAREDRAAADRRARHSARRAGPSREAARPTYRERDYDDDPRAPGSGAGTEDDLSRQADQLMAQASEIGASVLSKATSFWNQGKERALKVYEEQRKAYEQQQTEKRRPADGRPRWMVEAEEREAAERGEHRASGESAHKANGGRNGHGHGNDNGFHDRPSGSEFRDDFDDDDGHDSVLAPRPTQKRLQQPRAADPRSNLNLSAKDRADLLFADAPTPRQYVSKNRHAKGRSSPAPAAAVYAPTPPRAPTPLVHRQLVPASPTQLASAAQHKAKGNEHFKLGRFAEADAAYTSAISALPAGHIVLVTLHNNRAATRLKLGEGPGAASDCTAALDIIGPTYHPSKEAPLPSDVDVKLADALVKATTKRAQAWEMTEKWKQALEDWQKVLGFDAGVLAAAGGAAGAKSLASDGVRRAKAMLSGDGDGPKPAAAVSAARPSAPKPKPVPSRPTDVNRSAAVGELRKAAAAAGAEEEERIALKDGVDARLNAWRHGKETNLRALVASLDTVLWDGILAGGLKVGMHELVTEKQVKIKYMKVIARLHPDKLKVGDTTVEQRMLANGAFGTLNEAWAAFNGS